jgi:hypothetical protein
MRAPRTRSARPARKIERKIERRTTRSGRLEDPFEERIAKRKDPFERRVAERKAVRRRSPRSSEM